ncbi:phosphoribosylanthranilate isomerase [Methylovirgula sp. 4M-Z18]|uniref:phosphoribosylanthranilate isomerase n=1 Tax=Methylovirgula sp. 4M-Z18 TaxID=2293567 RepID=UPI000E2F6B3F|nr:phosphoribosylanthranilate isomerase [Methylovirgula sp. 4M-Z18]RFB78787.1 phosphoribosylanthranilate isomerase [Methylovirgula sp. 4M-Z18]
MIPRLKVCCISSPEELRLAVAAGADALGFVGDMPSGSGVIGDELSRALVRLVPPPVASVLLTAYERAEDIARHVQDVGANTVQIVNHIDKNEYRALREAIPTARLIQVIHVEDDHALDLAREYAEVAHALLLDSGRPSAAVPELGGTGRTHDWCISARIVQQIDIPIFLAGGITPANVREAIAQVRPYGIDLCSGVRTCWHLDPEKLAALTHAMWT